MKFTSVLLAGFAGLASVNAKVHQLWSLNAESEARGSRVQLANKRLQPLSQKYVFEADVQSLLEIEESDYVSFDIPAVEGVIRKECRMKKGNLAVPSALHEKLPNVVLLRGRCGVAEEVSIIADSTKEGSLSMRLSLPNSKTYYVDAVKEGANEYLIYDVDVALREGKGIFFDSPIDFEDMDFLQKKIKDQENLPTEKQSAVAYKFRFAAVANNQYSAFHGDTVDSTFLAMAVMMDRVNGVYMHEFAVFFEFIEQTLDLICVASANDALCNGLSNDSGLFFEVGDFLANKGIQLNQYDIGHGLSTGSGGRGNIGSVCNNAVKSQGTTGLPEPINDPFAIDYVAHEIGHQSFGRHSFRDCAGPGFGATDPQAAVEPGSAVTIMSYAGLCGANNIASNSEPIFDNHNLIRMRGFFDSIINPGTCGESFDVDIEIPTVSAPPTCRIPATNYFQLKGTSSSKTNDVAENYYSWNRVDLAIEDFDSPVLGKFRHWMPTKSDTRFFPNLFFLNYPDPEFERLEKVPRIGRSMTFRFVDRVLFDAEVRVGEFDLGSAGQFGYADTVVQFEQITPLTLFFPQSGDLVQSGGYTFKWSAGETTNIGSLAEFFVAINPLTPPTDPTAFDYLTDVKDFEWIKIGEAPLSDDEVYLEIPNLGLDVGETVEVNFMMRASEFEGADAESCYFFDLATGVTLEGAPVVTSAPTLPPTDPQTDAPTTFPPATPAPTNDDGGDGGDGGDVLDLELLIIILAGVVFGLSVVLLFVAITYSRSSAAAKRASSVESEGKTDVIVQNPIFDADTKQTL